MGGIHARSAGRDYESGGTEVILPVATKYRATSKERCYIEQRTIARVRDEDGRPVAAHQVRCTRRMRKIATKYTPRPA